MSALVLDTDIASLSFKDQLSARMQARLDASLVCVTFVTLGELTRWARLHSWGPRPRARLQMWPASRGQAPLRRRDRPDVG